MSSFSLRRSIANSGSLRLRTAVQRYANSPARSLWTPLDHQRRFVSLPAHTVSPSSPSTSDSMKDYSEGLSFQKYHGLGNDFILIDNRNSEEPLVSAERAVAMCDRHRGIGGDGVIFLLPPGAVEVEESATGKTGIDASMRIFNSDGSEPEMCGNGIRCLAKFMDNLTSSEEATIRSDNGNASNNGTLENERVYNIATLAGIIRPKMMSNGDVRVDMGAPILEPSLVPTTLAANAQSGSSSAVVNATINTSIGDMGVTCVSMGNPHCIIFVDSLDSIPFDSLGPELESNVALFPAKTNVEFIEVVRDDYVKMRVWERGAGPTQACGTGACATVVAAVLEGRTKEQCTVLLPGGELHIEWDREGSSNTVYMTGPAEIVFGGRL